MLHLKYGAKYWHFELNTYRAGLSIVPVVPWEGPAPPWAPADQLPNFYHAVLTFERSVYA